MSVGVGVLVGVTGVGVLVGVAGVGVLVGVAGVGVRVGVDVGVPGVAVLVGVAVRVGVEVAVGVIVGVRVGVLVTVGVCVGVAVLVGVLVGVAVFVGVNVGVGVLVGVCVGVAVFVGVNVGVAVFVGVDVGVAVLVAVAVGVAVLVGVGVGVRGHGGKLCDFSLVAVCSTRMLLTPLRIWLMSSGPKFTVLEFATTVCRDPGISGQEPSPGLWSVTNTSKLRGYGPGILPIVPTMSPFESQLPEIVHAKAVSGRLINATTATTATAAATASEAVDLSQPTSLKLARIQLMLPPTSQVPPTEPTMSPPVPSFGQAGGRG